MTHKNLYKYRQRAGAHRWQLRCFRSCRIRQTSLPTPSFYKKNNENL